MEDSIFTRIADVVEVLAEAIEALNNASDAELAEREVVDLCDDDDDEPVAPAELPGGAFPYNYGLTELGALISRAASGHDLVTRGAFEAFYTSLLQARMHPEARGQDGRIMEGVYAPRESRCA